MDAITAREIILAPVVTEKSVGQIADKKYTFRVAKDANKIQIARAVEEIFGVKVKKVNTISMKAATAVWADLGATVVEKGGRYPDRRLQDHRILDGLF